MQDPDKAYKYSPISGEPLTWKSKDMLLDEETGFEFYITPKLGTGIIITNEKGQVLLGKRSHDPYKGFWNSPGGHIDYGETAEDCIKRETREEVGIELTEVKLFRTYVLDYPSQGINYKMLGIFFTAEISLEESKSLSPKEGTSEIQFFELDKIPLDKIGGSANKQALKDYFNL